MKVIDVHAHVFPDAVAQKAVDNLRTYYSYTMHGNGKFDDLKASAEEAGIEKLVIHSTATKPYQVEDVNNFTSSLIGENVIGFGSVHPDYPEKEKEIERIISLGLKGIKLHPDFQKFNIDDEKMFPVYEYLSGKLPILFHVGDINSDCSNPRRLAKVVDMFPHLTVIAAHLGGYSQWDEAEEYLIGKDIYIDTSSTFRALSDERIERIIKKHDINKVLFGTDYPLERHKGTVEHTLRLNLSDDAKKKILYTNAYNLLCK